MISCVTYHNLANQVIAVNGTGTLKFKVGGRRSPEGGHICIPSNLPFSSHKVYVELLCDYYQNKLSCLFTRDHTYNPNLILAKELLVGNLKIQENFVGR